MNKDNSIVSKNYNLYAILYTEDNKQNIYNVDTGKIFKGINGSILRGDTGFDPTVMYKYGYVILANGSSKDFVNFKTGKVGFSIKDNIRSFVEDSKNSIVYNTNYNKFKVYNSNGKLLFDG